MHTPVRRRACTPQRLLNQDTGTPLSTLGESDTNPRRTFEPTKQVELAHSLTMHGLIQPITVRPKGDRFEVVAGARRFRAAQIAELPLQVSAVYMTVHRRVRHNQYADAELELARLVTYRGEENAFSHKRRASR